MTSENNREIIDWIGQGENPAEVQDRALLVDTAIGVNLYERNRELVDKVIEAGAEQRKAARLIAEHYRPNAKITPMPAAIIGNSEPRVLSAFSPFSLVTNWGTEAISYMQQKLEEANPGISSTYLRKVRRIIALGIPGTDKVTSSDTGVVFHDDSLTVEELERCPRVARRTANVIMRFLNHETAPIGSARSTEITHNDAA